MPVTLPPLDITALQYQFGLRAEKSLGQNFLVDQDALAKIVEAAGIQPSDKVLEIGPGFGSLTRLLALTAQSVTAVELDKKIITALQHVLALYPNVTVIQGDILELSPHKLMQSDDYLVVANVPYYITSAIFRHLLEQSVRPRRMVLTVQKEVAERVCALPGDMSLLALSIQVYGEPHIAAILPASSFFPAPKVDSAVICVDILPAPRIAPDMLPTFFHLIKAGFSQKRKTLRNSLSAGLRLSTSEANDLLLAVGIDPMRRAETVSISEWGELCRHYRLITPS